MQGPDKRLQETLSSFDVQSYKLVKGSISLKQDRCCSQVSFFACTNLLICFRYAKLTMDQLMFSQKSFSGEIVLRVYTILH